MENDGMTLLLVIIADFACGVLVGIGIGYGAGVYRGQTMFLKGKKMRMLRWLGLLSDCEWCGQSFLRWRGHDCEDVVSLDKAA
jgi:hypothetical protein